jgi:histidine kinase-like protein
MHVHLALHLQEMSGKMGSAVSQRIGGKPALPGVAMRSESLNPVVSVHSRDKYQAPLPTRTRVRPMTRAAIAEALPKHPLPDRPRVVRMPSDWWDAPSVVALALTPGPQPAKTARRFTRSTLGRWGLDPLADDAEVIVAELVANALCHGCVGSGGGDRDPERGDTRIGLRLFRRSGEVMCAVLDPSDTPPVLRAPNYETECGRGLQLVDALCDVWGWSPVAGRGKAVWAILFCP